MTTSLQDFRCLPGHQRKYKAVYVLALLWHDKHEEDFLEEAKILTGYMQEKLNYTTMVVSIPVEPHAHHIVDALIGQLVDRYGNDPDTLLIVHYGGHGIDDERDDKLLWAPTLDDSYPNSEHTVADQSTSTDKVTNTAEPTTADETTKRPVAAHETTNQGEASSSTQNPQSEENTSQEKGVDPDGSLHKEAGIGPTEHELCYVEWTIIQQRYFAIDETRCAADVLLIFDCCNAGVAARNRDRFNGGRRRMELLAACATGLKTPMPSYPDTFTKVFIKTLKKMFRRGDRVDIRTLHSCLCKSGTGLQQSPFLVDFAGPSMPSIVLHPLERPAGSLFTLRHLSPLFQWSVFQTRTRLPLCTFILATFFGFPSRRCWLLILGVLESLGIRS